MTYVFIVEHDEFGESEVDGVFSTKELADQFTGRKEFEKLRSDNPLAVIKDLNGHWVNCPPRFDYRVRRMELDSRIPLRWELRGNFICPIDDNVQDE